MLSMLNLQSNNESVAVCVINGCLYYLCKVW